MSPAELRGHQTPDALLYSWVLYVTLTLENDMQRPPPPPPQEAIDRKGTKNERNKISTHIFTLPARAHAAVIQLEMLITTFSSFSSSVRYIH